MLSYDETMSRGAAEYEDVLRRLARAGFPATFTQTGGMNAALDVTLEGGYFLLITDGQEPSPGPAKIRRHGASVSTAATMRVTDHSPSTRRPTSTPTPCSPS